MSELLTGVGGAPDECWVGVGWDNGNGYRYIRLDGRKQYVHRVAYELHIGPIPDGLYIDHLCRNRACWNPGHLEAVTNEVNILRGESAPARNSRKAQCPRCGADYRRDGRYRRCQPCRQRRRTDTKRLGIGRPAERTHCPHGHAYDAANTIIKLRPDGTVKQRACRRCRVEQQRARRARAKAATS